MWTVATPATDGAWLYSAVAARRRAETQSLLEAARESTLAAYDAYRAAADDVTTLVPLEASAALRAAWSSNYERFKETQEDLYAAMKLAARWCPMCGERAVVALDHYLPRSVYPELAILPTNLVPVCSDCNWLKSNDFCEGAGNPLFLHAYFDDLSAVQCVRASVDLSSGSALLTFTIDCPDDISPPLAERTRRHFVRLGLQDFYRAKGEQEASIRALEVRELLAAGDSPAGVSESLARAASSSACVVGPNHWRPVALYALANHDDFCAGACET
jgi:hypothetical protein